MDKETLDTIVGIIEIYNAAKVSIEKIKSCIEEIEENNKKITGLVYHLEKVNNSIKEAVDYIYSKNRISVNKFNSISTNFENAKGYIVDKSIEFKENNRYCNWKKYWNATNSSFNRYENEKTTDNLKVLVSNLEFFARRNADLLDDIFSKYIRISPIDKNC